MTQGICWRAPQPGTATTRGATRTARMLTVAVLSCSAMLTACSGGDEPSATPTGASTASTGPAASVSQSTAASSPATSGPSAPSSPQVIPSEPEPGPPTEHRDVSPPQLRAILAAPGKHVGEGIVVYAVVTDPAGQQFEASVTAANPLKSDEWIEGDPALFTATAKQVRALSEGDILKLWVTSLGGTEPNFRVDQLQLLGASE